MSRMATTDIVIHKGEKEEKYQLYVEDYVMSYLKNYKEEEGTVFFYGKREQGGKKYYIYGAGEQRQITYFNQYVLLDEIRCRVAMDMPVFSVREASGIYELAGYYIFYQSNEAMQNYMVEHRKEVQYRSGAKPKKQKIEEQKTEAQERRAQKIIEAQQNRNYAHKPAEKKKGGLMTLQLSAIFVVLIAIVINSTNSYTKLEELNQAAVEVFFAMENEEAVDNGDVTLNSQTENDVSMDMDIPTEGTILRLEDLDAKFEEENQAVKQEGTEPEEEGQDTEKEAEKEVASVTDSATAIEETTPSQQAYGRNFVEYYQIEKGDTLYKISIKLYGDTSKVDEICELNQITDPDNIKYGQKILLP